MSNFPYYKQLDSKDCGPTCLRMVAKYYGCNYSLQYLREKSFITRQGVSLLGISYAAESIGLRTNGLKLSFEALKNKIELPCILHWNRQHFVVCYKIQKDRIYIADPMTGKCVLNKTDFLRYWTGYSGEDTGIALSLKPAPTFYNRTKSNSKDPNAKDLKLRYYFKYLIPYKSQLIQLVVGMLIGSILQMIFPFLTQAMIDKGINAKNLNFITLVLLAQLVLFFTQLFVDLIRNWIVLHMNTRINIELISDFLIKLMKLPLSFFDIKNVGDIMQRIGDHNRIEALLTGSSFYSLFSVFNFFVFAFILGFYNMKILGIFLLGNLLYVLSVLFFMRYRKELDYRRFMESSQNQSNMIQMITGMQEIKLNNYEKQQRWNWERIQVRLFHISVSTLTLGQCQQTISSFINKLFGLIISFTVARLVVKGEMTLGMMMSVSYIMGQLSSPISQWISLLLSFQDAKISLERLNEINTRNDEEEDGKIKIKSLPTDRSMYVENVCFSYDGSEKSYILHNICLEIPENKVTAIVGASGSGKTTLLKLLMGFYEPNTGNIKVDNCILGEIDPHLWRERIGCVMQEGFIFSDTISQNIAVGADEIDMKRMLTAIKIANIKKFIDSLPLGLNTKIGMEGSGISFGQRQRILIARAVYKQPDFLFFDEATNSLDSNNERIIMNNMEEVYKGKTVVVVAHRLSTVQHADKIVVLNSGHVVEEGTHSELVALRGEYYQLVKSQLELGG